MPRKTPDGRPRRQEFLAASMRPRPDAAENPLERVTERRRQPSFNEAAARCRGKPPLSAAGSH